MVCFEEGAIKDETMYDDWKTQRKLRDEYQITWPSGSMSSRSGPCTSIWLAVVGLGYQVYVIAADYPRAAGGSISRVPVYVPHGDDGCNNLV